jgi:hypothetical protein
LKECITSEEFYSIFFLSFFLSSIKVFVMLLSTRTLVYS